MKSVLPAFLGMVAGLVSRLIFHGGLGFETTAGVDLIIASSTASILTTHLNKK